MTCNEFRQWFQDHESDEMTDSIRGHLSNCATCRDMFDLDRKLETKLRTNFVQLEVPARLQERLDQNLGSNNLPRIEPRWIRRAVVPALAMAAMLVLFLFPMGYDNSSFGTMDELGRLAIVDHLSHGTEGCSSTAQLDLAAWSEQEVGYRVNMPEVPEGAELLAASKCRLGDCDTVHLIYSLGEEHFSVFVLPKKEAGFKLEQEKFYSLNFGEHQVRLWRSGGQIQAMVTG